MPTAKTLVFDAAIWNRHAILSTAEMRRAEEIAIARGTLGFSLMQRAGEGAAKIIRQKWQPCRTLVLCGPGNNGGDGFVLAEQLRRADWDVTVAAMRVPQGLEGDAGLAAETWQGDTHNLDGVSFEGFELVVDAIFGTGLARPLEGIPLAAIRKLAETKIPVVAVDIPSGLHADTGAVLGAVAPATLTLTFFRKKPAHIFVHSAKLCGEIAVVDIGIRDEILQDVAPRTAENVKDLWLDLFPFPASEGHKYDRGHAIISGGAVMTGAARLGARAAQRMGAGLITLAAPESVVPIYAAALESVIVRAANKLSVWKELLADEKRNAVLVGPGLGIGKEQADYVLAALATGKPCVLDADALSNFSSRPNDLFLKLNTECVLTPHEGEFTRLFGDQIDPQADKISRARRAAEIAGCIVLLKGADTVIADPDGHTIVNACDAPWLATAGAGDVLAGMILGLLAQDVPAFAAAAMAAWIHGRAAEEFGLGLIAEDLIAKIPHVLQGLSANPKSV